ncbi:MAG: inorganic phosphate transporter [Alphaproteobacteria bacterium]
MLLTILIIAVALVFDFINGFHDAANSVATIVATRVLKPFYAVLWASLFNFLALFVFGTGVAKTVGSGMVDLAQVTPIVILAGLIGAIVWNLLTWWWRLPSSSSHALLGGYAGAAIAHHAASAGLGRGLEVIIASGWTQTLLFMLLAPLIGMALSAALLFAAERLEKLAARKPGDKFYGRLQLASSAFLSLTHGSNDAQKTAGIITGALVASGSLAAFEPPYWVLLLSYLVMGLGTLAGGWRIIYTLGFRLTQLRPQGGFCAETGAALSILIATLLHLPISTTHAATGSIIGVGLRQKIQWSMARRIALAWLLTLPAAALMGAAMALVLQGL